MKLTLGQKAGHLNSKTCSSIKNQEGRKYRLLRSEQTAHLILIVKRRIEDKCSMYLTKKERPYTENVLNENRIFNIPIYKGQFHLCGPSKQIMPHYQKDSLFLFKEADA
jgi:hypothetical protein